MESADARSGKAAEGDAAFRHRGSGARGVCESEQVCRRIPQGVCLHASEMPQKKERIVRGVEAAHKTNELRIKGRKGKSGLAGEKQVLYNKIESQTYSVVL